MIIAYHRPKTLAEALALLSGGEAQAIPIGGGSAFDRAATGPLAVVDLQDLGLNGVQDRANFMDLGATATLQALLETARLPQALHEAIRHEATHNLRQVATVAGTLVAADGRSPFTTALLALDASLTFLPGGSPPAEGQVSLGDFLALRQDWLRGRLITRAAIPLNARLTYTYVARTPADRPIVCAAAAVWPSGRTRVALGGYGPAPILAMDGPEAAGAEAAARNAYSQAGDAWASAEYRQEVAGVLVRRCLEET
jgi:CO/xanthine dehydrogenase FAD-binding subunit